jgi:AcrR family transcriptional regulator
MPNTKTQKKPAATAAERRDPSRRIRLDRTERRQTLLDAGAKAFAKGGFQGTAMESVAKNAGITRLIIYRHFASKDELYRAVLDRAVEEVRSAVTTQLASGRTVGSVVKAFLDAARKDPNGFKLLVRYSAHEPEFQAYAERFKEGAVEAAEELIAGRVPDPVLRGWAAQTLLALLEESTLAWIEKGDPARDSEMNAVLTSSIEAMLGGFASDKRSK